jgi:hypothetical protein
MNADRKIYGLMITQTLNATVPFDQLTMAI